MTDAAVKDAGWTPGPRYYWLPRGVDEGCREIRTEKGRTHGGYHGNILAATYGLSNNEEDEANARLIAAADEIGAKVAERFPSLKEANDADAENFRVTAADIRTALAAARGES